MNILLAVVVAALLLAGFAFFLRAAQRLYRRMQRRLTERGYRSPVAIALSGGLALLLTLGAFLVVAQIVGADNALPAIFVLALAVPAAMALGVRLLPARPARIAGARVTRFPYRRASHLLFAGAVALAVTAVAAEIPPLGNVAALSAVGGLVCREIARRSALPEAAAVLATDTRAPVLYLRPFARDDEIFAEVPRTPRQFWTDWGRNIARTTSLRHLTLETYLKDEVGAIGPWIGLGNPLDFLPPDGAARTYLADHEWQARFRELAQGAACSVMVAGVSPQIRWEMATLRELGLHRRFFVLTPPRLPRAAPLSRLLTRPPRMRRPSRVAWADVAAALRSAGYRPGADDPGPGAVIGFDAEGRTILLARGTSSAAEVVEAMACALSGLPTARVPV